jgi:RHS repeat-associated protein
VLAAFGYDDLGRRTSLTRGNGTSTSYSYDPASRLSQLADNPAGTTHDQTLSFAYNPASQIVSNTRSNDLFAWTGHGSGTTSSTANGLNQLASLGAATPGYDSKGNMTSDTARSYSYASDNQMVSGGGLAMIHDPLGRLIWVQNQGWVTDYAGAEVADELAVTTYAIQRRFVYGPGVDEPLVSYEGSGTTDRRFLHADERGSIVAVSNSAGTVTNVNTYDEYGKPGSGNVGRFQYTGQKWIADLGLYDYKARMYHPGLGRFMQPDPIGYKGGMNMYGGMGSDPVNLADPSGTRVTEHGGSNCSIGCGVIQMQAWLITEGYHRSRMIEGERVQLRDVITKQYIQLPNGDRFDVEGLSRGGIVYLAGTFNGTRVFGDNPTFSNRQNRFFPGGRITSAGQGGFVGALADLDTLARLNHITAPSGVNIFKLPPHGWIASINPVSGYQILTHSSGLTFRANGATGVVVIDIPAGFIIGTGAFDVSTFVESVHYRGR